MPSASKLLGDLVSSAGAISVTSGVANTAITGTITTAQIADAAITTPKIADGSIVTADIADANVTAVKLANTAVTAGVYGGSSNSALITVDSQGRITAASNVAAAGGVTSLNGQSGEITNTTQYAIGSYVLGRPFNVTTYNDSTIAGTSLYATPGGVIVQRNEADTAFGFTTSGGQASGGSGTSLGVLVNTGSWRCVSLASFVYNNGGPRNQAGPGLWVRYA